MALPKIVYNPGTGPVTLTILRPMRFQCGGDYEATRHDNIASSGVPEHILERIDSFFDFTIEWVGVGADLSAWNAFVLYALTGGQFQYFPDGAQPGYTNYWLEGTNWKAPYKSPGQKTFKMRWRQVVT